MKTIAATMGILVIGLFAASSFASTCIRKEPAVVAREASIAFVGRVVNVAPSDFERASNQCTTPSQNQGCGSRLNTIEVLRTLRGTVPKRVAVISEDVCSCFGAFFALDREYLVVAERNVSRSLGDYIAKSTCDGTVPLGHGHDAEVLRAWGEAGK